MKQRQFLLCVFFISSHLYLHAQPQNFAGVNLTVESGNGMFTAGFGFPFERRLTKHSGFETGLYFRTYKITGEASDGYSSHYFFIAEKYVSVPFLYKFFSRFMNLSIGRAVDLYSGWRQTSGKEMLHIEYYSIKPKISAGAMVKLSKPMNITDQIFLELEIRINPGFSSFRHYCRKRE